MSLSPKLKILNGIFKVALETMGHENRAQAALPSDVHLYDAAAADAAVNTDYLPATS